jgi:hypothetical protein
LKLSCFFFITGAAFIALILSGCGSTSSSAPPITAAIMSSGARAHETREQLAEGRSLFVSRCIECHVLPAIASHSEREWPRLIDEMSGRANLKPAERNSLLAYILAARAQM